MYDGIDMRDYDRFSLYSCYGILFQDYVHYMSTARENIAYGDLASLDDFNHIQAMAKLSGADAFVRTLPKQYETPLTRSIDDGVDLSGGQWQMLSLARALMRRAPIVILDEPTSALSPTAESEVFEMLRNNLTEQQIGIFVSHRFSTIRQARRIIVMDQGRITEMGSHEDLIALHGQYARMYTIQAEAFK